MRIGVHPSNLHLRLASVWPDAFAEFGPQFVHYGEGRDTARLIHEKAFVFGGTGSTPPILADAAGLPVRYIAASAPRPANGAIFVAKNSAIKTVADLKGKTVTLVDGSFQTYLLARSLEGVGLSLGDVERVELAPEASLPALLHGDVDAWISMAPRLERALVRDDIRLIVKCGSTIPNRSLFWTLAETGLSNGDRVAIVAELSRIGAEVAADPKEAAARLFATSPGEADAAAWERVVRSRDFSVVAADEVVLAEQREEADTLHRHGFLQQLPANPAADLNSNSGIQS